MSFASRDGIPKDVPVEARNDEATDGAISEDDEDDGDDGDADDKATRASCLPPALHKLFANTCWGRGRHEGYNSCGSNSDVLANRVEFAKSYDLGKHVQPYHIPKYVLAEYNNQWGSPRAFARRVEVYLTSCATRYVVAVLSNKEEPPHDWTQIASLYGVDRRFSDDDPRREQRTHVLVVARRFRRLRIS